MVVAVHNLSEVPEEIIAEMNTEGKNAIKEAFNLPITNKLVTDST